ncbi:hypothetical protein TSMEX_006630 [Taenia solium]|eukprot:TsM_000291600 transcript=TsM_000291600 gene=TsM_000291600
MAIWRSVTVYLGIFASLYRPHLVAIMNACFLTEFYHLCLYVFVLQCLRRSYIEFPISLSLSDTANSHVDGLTFDKCMKQ